jgi:hypothetical protein
MMQSPQQADFIEMVTGCLVDNFINQLNELTEEKNYFTHVGSLAEIVDWSMDFYEEYYHSLDDWNHFKVSSANIYKAGTINDFIMAFGREKLKMFCIENGNYTADYFRDKYLAIEW